MRAWPGGCRRRAFSGARRGGATATRVERVLDMLTSIQTEQYQDQGFLTLIKDQPDRRQFLVRGRAVANGHVYYGFGKLEP